jgi:dTDP-4-dehydrorhamnose reductase
MKLIVTGAHGFVAGSVLAQAGDSWEAHAISRGGPVSGIDARRCHTCDPQQPGQWAQLFRELRPQAVIHTAAVADIDYCQAHSDVARAANVDFTQMLVEQCAETGVRLVHCSTDTIFDGEHAPYSEEDPPGPINVYAETKVAAEQQVAGLGSQAVIARLALVVGLPMLGAGNSFLVRSIAALKAGKPVSVPEREVRTPVDVVTLGRALLELAGEGHHGIFHLGGCSRVNRLEMSRQIAAAFRLPEHLVVAQEAAQSPARAVRPRDVSLNNAKARAQLQTPMLTLAEALTLIQQTANGATL